MDVEFLNGSAGPLANRRIRSLLTLGFYLKQRRLFLIDREERTNREKTSVER